MRSGPGRLQVPGGPAGPDRVVGRAQLAPVADGLLQVVADELVLAGLALEPAGEALVELGPVRLGDGPVGRLLDQQVAEAELVLAAGR